MGSGSGLASARAAAWTDWDSVQTGSLLCRKEGCVPEAQRWASGMTKRASPGLMHQLSLSPQVCQTRHGPGRLNGRSLSAFPGDLLDLVPPHQKAPGAEREPGLGIIPTPALLLHYKRAHVTISDAILPIHNELHLLPCEPFLSPTRMKAP